MGITNTNENSVLLMPIINHERVNNEGEDFYYISSFEDYKGILSVYDGCGGLGAMQYPELGNKTGAYNASRAAGEAVKEWSGKTNIGHGLKKNSAPEIKKAIMEELTSIQKKTETKTAVKGTMYRPFPTTMAAAVVIGKKQKSLEINAVWAGDSRVYTLNSNGLAQLSVDDIKSNDDLDNLTGDGVLTNVISADGNFDIHIEKYKLPLPCIIITATDGCFGYIFTPMHFEYTLLNSMQNSSTMEEWKKKIEEELDEVSGDDFTMCLAAFGFNSFEDIKQHFSEREKFIDNHYVAPIESQDEDSEDKLIESLWTEYKGSYYTYLKIK